MIKKIPKEGSFMNESITKALKLLNNLANKAEYQEENILTQIQAMERLLTYVKVIFENKSVYNELKSEFYKDLETVGNYIKQHNGNGNNHHHEILLYAQLTLGFAQAFVKELEPFNPKLWNSHFKYVMNPPSMLNFPTDLEILWSRIIYYYVGSIIQINTGQEGLFLKEALLPLLEIIPERDFNLYKIFIESILTLHTHINKFPYLNLNDRLTSIKKSGCLINSEQYVQLPSAQNPEEFFELLAQIETSIKENEKKHSHLGNLLLHLNIRFRIKQNIQNLEEELDGTIEQVKTLINSAQKNLNTISQISLANDTISEIIENKINSLRDIDEHLHELKNTFIKNLLNRIDHCENNEADILKMIVDSRKLIKCLLTITHDQSSHHILKILKKISTQLEKSEERCKATLDEIKTLKIEYSDYKQNSESAENQYKKIISELNEKIDELKTNNKDHQSLINKQTEQLSMFAQPSQNQLNYHDIVVKLDYYCLFYADYLHKFKGPIVEEKIKSIDALRRTLSAPVSDLKKITFFRDIFPNHKAIIEKHRDGWGAFVLKTLACILSLDTLSYFKNKTWYFWHSNGKEVNLKIERLLSSTPNVPSA